MNIFSPLLVAILVFAWSPDKLSAGVLEYQWYISITDSNENVQSLPLGKEGHEIKVSTGWKCIVGKVSKNNARQTQCTKDNEQIEFTVMCDSNNPRDHQQIRFREVNVAGKYGFVEVGCKPRVNFSPAEDFGFALEHDPVLLEMDKGQANNSTDWTAIKLRGIDCSRVAGEMGESIELDAADEFYELFSQVGLRPKSVQTITWKSQKGCWRNFVIDKESCVLFRHADCK